MPSLQPVCDAALTRLEHSPAQSFCRYLDEVPLAGAGGDEEYSVYGLCLALHAQGAQACPKHVDLPAAVRLDANSEHSTLKPSRGSLATKLALLSDGTRRGLCLSSRPAVWLADCVRRQGHAV